MSSFAGELSRCKITKSHEHIVKICEALHPEASFDVLKKEGQVMASETKIEKIQVHGKEIALLFDGELYNQDELKSMCLKKGHPVESDRPEEVLLKLYLSFHEEFVSKINGSFSVVIVDEVNEMCLLARDPMGLRPLFYSLREDGLVFASLIRALLKHPDIKACAGAEELMELICIGPGRTPGKTYFKDIEEIKPGHRMIVTKNGVEMIRYFSLQDEVWNHNEEETVQIVHDLLKDAILRQSKGNVCAMLSGGLDSSIVCAQMQQVKSPLKTYSVDYKEQHRYFKPTFFQPNRDQDYIDLMVKRYNLDAQEIILNHEELIEYLKEAMIARDMPSMADVDSSLLCFLKKMKEKGESVVLSGECSDEIFGGYPWYTKPHLRTLDQFPWANNVKERSSYLKEEFVNEDPEEFVRKRIQQSLRQLSFRKDCPEEEKQMKQLMKLNLDWFMSTLADRAERMARRWEMIVRVPFCDVRIVEALYQIPWSMKFQNETEKFLLRKAFEDELPEEVAWRKKSPYPKTHHPEYRDMIKTELKKVIDDESSPIHEILRKEKLMELIESDEPKPWYGQLMTGPQTMAYFLQINEWLKEYHVEIIHPKG